MNVTTALALIRHACPEVTAASFDDERVRVTEGDDGAFIAAATLDDLNDDDVAYLVKGMLHGRGA